MVNTHTQTQTHTHTHENRTSCLRNALGGKTTLTQKPHTMLAERTAGQQTTEKQISHICLRESVADAGWTHQQLQMFLAVFDDRTSFRKRAVKITIILEFLTIEPHFVGNCRIFVIARGHSPPSERREISRPKRREKRREEKRRESRGKRCEICRGQI